MIKYFPNIDFRPAHFFKLRSKLVNHKLLDVEKAKKKPGAKVMHERGKGMSTSTLCWKKTLQELRCYPYTSLF